MKYINVQHHVASCGSVALINTLKWLGYNASYREHINSFDGWMTDETRGMPYHILEDNLSNYDIDFQYVSCPSIRDMESVLDGGNAIILSYSWAYYKKNGHKKKNGGAHYIFIEGQTDKTFKAKNVGADSYYGGMKKKMLAKYFRTSKAEKHREHPEMWVINDTIR